MEQKEIIVLVGVPGSGKSTFANQLVKSTDRYVKISRDDIRHMLKNSYVVGEELEGIVSAVQDATIKAVLLKGKSVVLDNTHCKAKYIKEIADKYGKDATITIKIIGAELSTKQIKEQNKQRDKVVPEEVIDRMYTGFKNVVKTKSDLVRYINESVITANSISPANQDKSLPKAILCDIDGTVAHMEGKRGPFEWHKVGLDEPDHNILNIVRSLSPFYKVIFMSGRLESCREETEAWLTVYYGENFELFMRPKSKEFIKDSIVKTDLYNENIKGKYYVEAVFDDRKQVVDTWRNELGLKCLQVQEGNF